MQCYPFERLDCNFRVSDAAFQFGGSSCHLITARQCIEIYVANNMSQCLVNVFNDCPVSKNQALFSRLNICSRYIIIFKTELHAFPKSLHAHYC